MIAAYPEFRQSRCTRYRYRYSECCRCADACPHDAIALDDEGAAVDAARCQNCGLCSAACRTGAWDAGNLRRVDLLKQAIKATHWSFACAPSGAVGDSTVPCLGAVDASMHAYLAKRGIAVELCGARHCTRCVHGAKGAGQLASQTEALAMLRAASGEPWAPLTIVVDEVKGGNPSAGFAPNRRQLFRRLLGRAATEMQAPLPAAVEPIPDKAIRAARPFVSEPRELMQIVARKREGGAFVVREHEALPLLKLVMQDGCTACEACFRACPSGALQVRETDTSWSLAFNADHCVACEVCLEVCRPQVLRPAPEFDATPGAAEMVLHSLAKQRCRRCDRAFVSPEPAAACAVCTDDESAFDAIFG